MSLPSRLRQVFEFLVFTILESLFVKKEEEDLKVGGEDAQQKMVSKTEHVDRHSSEQLLQIVCEILFSNVNRYLHIKSLFSKEESNNFFEGEQRFKASARENDSSFAIESSCAKDLAEHINKNGGHKIFTAK